MWVFDTPAQGWEAVDFNATYSFCTAAQSAASAAAVSAAAAAAAIAPGPRAGHAMVSSGRFAFACGGYGPPGAGGGQGLLGSEGALECWKLSLIPLGWTPIDWRPLDGGNGPAPRSGHAMVYDAAGGRMVLFGGLADGGELDDCWHANASAATTARGAWAKCAAAASTAVRPTARYGHGAAFFSGSLFVLGGYGTDGSGGSQALRDVWVLPAYAVAGGGGWTEVSATTLGPTARAFFACWLSGYRLYVHGGQVAANWSARRRTSARASVVMACSG
jgi:hypothetical protein